MGGLFKQATGQATDNPRVRGRPAAMGGSNPIGDLITEMMRQGMGRAQAKPAPRASPMGQSAGADP